MEWSLTFEVAANLIHAVWLWRCRTRTVAAAALAMMVPLVAVAWSAGALIDVGPTRALWLAGFVRVAVLYLLGIVVARWWRARPAADYGAAGLIAVALAPVVLALLALVDRWWIDPLVVIVGTPVILVVASRTTVPARWATTAGALGALSYPLYAIHLPLIDLGHIIGDATRNSEAVRIEALLAALAMAWLLARLTDQPRVGVIPPGRARSAPPSPTAPRPTPAAR